jgi:hypothetical protein
LSLTTIVADLARQTGRPGVARPAVPGAGAKAQGAALRPTLADPETLSMQRLSWYGPGAQLVELTAHDVNFNAESVLLTEFGYVALPLEVPPGRYILRFDFDATGTGSVRISGPSTAPVVCAINHAGPASCASEQTVSGSHRAIFTSVHPVTVTSATAVRAPP